ncbi:MAG TPA: hypothetical protein VLB86_06485 [Gaiellaceae bacterium]|nr:hypothetical protein [Gaiellaceae bacterium]
MIEYDSHVRRQLAQERAARIAAEYRRAQRASSRRRHRARIRARAAGIADSLRRWSVDHVPAYRQ